MLNGYAEVDIPLDSDSMFSGPVDMMALAVSTVADPTALMHSFLKLSPAFVKHEDMGTPIW